MSIASALCDPDQSKKVGKIRELRPLFLQLLSNKRYFSKTLLNALLQENGEAQL